MSSYTVNDYRTIIGRFVRKSFVIFIYRYTAIPYREVQGNTGKTL